MDCPVDERLFTYTWEGSIQPGDGVSVPFGSRMVGGIVVTLSDQPPEPERPLKSIESVLHRGFLPPAYWHLLEKIAHHYCTPLLYVVQTALPTGLLNRNQRRIARLEGDPSKLTPPALQLWQHLGTYQQNEVSWRALRKQFLRPEPWLKELESWGLARSYLYSPPVLRPKRQTMVSLVLATAATATKRQQAVLATLQHLGGEAPLSQFLETAKTTRPTVQKLVEQGWITLWDQEILRRGDSDLPYPKDQPKTLTPAQTLALSQIQTLTAGQTLLLWGVTGSGKTEIYLQAIAPLLAQGKSALVLVPEIGLTPQLTERFQQRFPGKIWVYHSALSLGERYDCWRQMLAGEAQVVIGTRSAIFAPLPHLGLMILDEEHDGAYKQDRPAPSYHARTVAQWRSVLEGCPLVLGSATPALESYHAAQTGRYQLSHLPERAGVHRGLPEVTVVDMREELHQGVYAPLSRRLQQEVQAMAERGEQGILFLNRRGYHTFILCRSCGEVLTCPHCTVSLTYHETDHILRCHHCRYSRPEPEQKCPACSSVHFRYFGTGTQKIESAVRKLFPALRVLRFDRDTTQRKGSHRQILERFSRGEAELLIGTQMLTKGLDLPQVTLIGILAADSLLNMPDFRCTERAFQLLTQVAGRSGRGSEPGRVVLQTYSPEHPVVLAAARQDYLQFTLPELADRAELGFPPFGNLVSLGWQGTTEAQVIQCAQEAAQELSQGAGEVLGPAPALIPRLRRQYRWQVLWKLPPTIPPQPLLSHFLDKVTWPKGVTCQIDVDPLQLW